MRKLRFTIGIVACAAAILVPTAGSVVTGTRAETKPGLGILCASVLAPITGGVAASGEPFAACQWDMMQIHATTAGSHAVASGLGVRVGVIDSGVDLTHPDIAPNLDLASSCSFIYSDTPAALPIEVANGDCSNKAAVQDRNGHGTHVASTIAAPVNGIGIAGVAPRATIVALKACSYTGFCFGKPVAAALRKAGDLRLDVVNLSLFADPYLFYCGNDAEQRAQYKALADAAKYAQQRGVVIVAAAGNEATDLQHPTIDTISPDWPPDSAVERVVHNNCRQAPTEIPGVLAVSATGPTEIASYSNVGMNAVGVAAPGGDYFAATGTVQDAILAAWTSTGEDGTWEFFDSLGFPGPDRGRRRRAVHRDHRYVDGVAARCRRRGARPADAPQLEPRCGDLGGRAKRDAARLSDAGARRSADPLLRRWRPDVVLRPRAGRRTRGRADVGPTASSLGPPRCGPRGLRPRITASGAAILPLAWPPSTSGLGHHPFKVAARVRIPLGALTPASGRARQEVV